jgi:hypothetical protein
VQLDRRLVDSRRKMKLAEDILKWTWSNTQVTIGEIPIFLVCFIFYEGNQSLITWRRTQHGKSAIKYQHG